MRKRFLGAVIAAAAAFAATGANAQREEGRAKPPPPPPCPAGGYAPPQYILAVEHDNGLRAYEIASPCSPQIVRDVAEAIGMGRGIPLGIKNITTLQFSATGRLADERGAMQEVEKVHVGISHILPAARFTIERRVGGRTVTEGRVFSDSEAWNEGAPGVDGVMAPRSRSLRAPLVKLTPFGAFWSIVEAEGHVTVTQAGGQTVLTGASPYDGYKVALTIGPKNLPAAATVWAEGRVYTATFADYRDTWPETKSPSYLTWFPHRLVWTVDGKPLADLTVTAFTPVPYVIFPSPDRTRRASR